MTEEVDCAVQWPTNVKKLPRRPDRCINFTTNGMNQTCILTKAWRNGGNCLVNWIVKA